MINRITIYLISLYQKIISPVLPSACRYYPSCSEYTKQAITKFGTIKGAWLGSLRILRCHPFAKGGYDPLEKNQTG